MLKIGEILFQYWYFWWSLWLGFQIL